MSADRLVLYLSLNLEENMFLNLDASEDGQEASLASVGLTCSDLFKAVRICDFYRELVKRGYVLNMNVLIMNLK